MKLNLVPTHVSKEKASGGAILLFAILSIVGVVLAVLMVATSSSKLDAAKKDEADALDNAASVKRTSDQADALMADKDTHDVVRDITLAEAMKAHSTVYPDLYDRVRQYVPSYYRVTSMAASPGGEDTCIVTLTGVLTTYQQYADLGLAFMRMPGAQTYTPSGYQITDKYVPNLTPEDRRGLPIRPGEGNIPDDPLRRLDYYIRQGHLTNYLAVSGYGDESTPTKGPMPDASLVTITITLKSDPLHHFIADLRTPDPRATLAAAASAATTSTAPGGGGAAAGFGAPPAATTPPPPTPPDSTPTGGGKKGKGAGDEE